MGRTTAFNATLFLTSAFGMFASFANTFVLLCIALFFLGSAVGVRMQGLRITAVLAHLRDNPGFNADRWYPPIGAYA